MLRIQQYLSGPLVPPPTGRCPDSIEPDSGTEHVAAWRESRPLYFLTKKRAPTLAVGCYVVAQPSETMPAPAFLLRELCTEAGLPAGGRSSFPLFFLFLTPS